jgi:hypothetical protein
MGSRLDDNFNIFVFIYYIYKMEGKLSLDERFMWVHLTIFLETDIVSVFSETTTAYH